MRKLGWMAAGAALAALAACGGGTKAGNNVAVTNTIYVGDDLGNDLLGNDVLLNDTALNAASGNAAVNASSNAAATNTTGNRL
jgi:hypothetical protein